MPHTPADGMLVRQQAIKSDSTRAEGEREREQFIEKRPAAPEKNRIGSIWKSRVNLPSWIALAQVSLKRALVRMLGISSAAGHVWLLAPGAWGWFLYGRVPCHPHRQQDKTHSLQHYRNDKPCFPYYFGAGNLFHLMLKPCLAHGQVVTRQNHGTAQQAGDGDFRDVGATSLWFHPLYLEEVQNDIAHLLTCFPHFPTC